MEGWGEKTAMALGEIRFHRMKEMYAGEGFMYVMLGWFHFLLPALLAHIIVAWLSEWIRGNLRKQQVFD